MVSTFLSYRLYTADLSKSVARTLSDAQVAREAEYYRQNIGKVTSVDDFLKDQRLYAYAMEAYGLEDMTYAKAFMRKVLESDLTQQDSFVRKLVDQRYLAFAKAFNFTPAGGIDAGTALAQDSGDEAETVELYSEQRVLKGQAVAAEVDYYKARLATLTSVDQLVQDPQLFSFALKAYGIDPDIASEAFIRSVLVGDPADPASPANASGDVRYQKLRAAFSFAPDGSAAPGAAQTTAQRDALVYLHYETTGNGASPAAAAFKTDLFAREMAAVTSVDDLLSNGRLVSYMLTAAGIDPSLTTEATLRAVLTSDPDDPESAANTLGSGYRTLAAAFNFNADGTLDDGVAAQTALQQKTLTDLYLDSYATSAAGSEKQQTDYYKLAIGTIGSVDDLLNDARLYNYVLKAYGLDPAEESKSVIRQVLTADPKDATSLANRLRNPSYAELAAAFNFGRDGKAQGAVQAQVDSARTATITLYASTLGSSESEKTAGTAESQYYSTTIATIGTADDLLKDKRLVAYIKKAFGLEGETVSDQELRQALTSDLYDLKSYANTSGDPRLRSLAAAFNFASDGTAKRVTLGQAQDAYELISTQDLYVRQTMEQKAGTENEGVRLALYFQRKASTITSAYSILADKALLEVVTTALGIPDAAAQADVDTQARMIEKRLDLADFKDPAKVEKFLARFTALYDINNPQSTQASVPSLLLDEQEGAVIGLDLLGSIQNLNLRL